MRLSAGKCLVCKPIENSVGLLESKGAIVRRAICRDIHFNEVLVEISGGPDLSEFLVDKVENINYDSRGFLYCTCHWSIIKRV